MHNDCEWVSSVLSDVVEFLMQSQLTDSARMLIVAAAYIDHEMKRQKQAPQADVKLEARVVMFPAKTQRFA
jgi:hypothetical protein